MRGLEAIRAGDGLALVGLTACGVVRDRPTVIAARLLGARRLVEAAVLARDPGPSRLRASAGLDAVHVISMLGLAWARPAHRRPALVSACASTALCLATAREASRGTR